MSYNLAGYLTFLYNKNIKKSTLYLNENLPPKTYRIFLETSGKAFLKGVTIIDVAVRAQEKYKFQLPVIFCC